MVGFCRVHLAVECSGVHSPPQVCRAFLCYYKQVPPPTDRFSLMDALRWRDELPESRPTTN